MIRHLSVLALFTGVLLGCNRGSTSATQSSRSTEDVTPKSMPPSAGTIVPTVKSYTTSQDTGGDTGQAVIIPSIAASDYVLLHYETHEAGITFTPTASYELLDSGNSSAPSYADWYATGLSGKNVSTFVTASAFSHGGVAAAVIAGSTGIDVHGFAEGKTTPSLIPAAANELPIVLYAVDATIPDPGNTGTLLGWKGYDLNSIGAYCQPKTTGSTPLMFTNAATFGTASDYASGLVLFKGGSGRPPSNDCYVPAARHRHGK